MSTQSSILEAKDLTKLYRCGSEEVRAVDSLSLSLSRGSFTAFVGPSGSGKTTLMNLIGFLDNPSAGELSINGDMIFSAGKTLAEGKLTEIRRQYFGYVFQKFYLVPTLTVKENIMLPLSFYNKGITEDDVNSIMDELGILNRKDHLPNQISGGEMQRTAIARALINKPQILLADEPTGNLDTARSNEIGAILTSLNQKKGLTVLMVTHNIDLAKIAGSVVELRDGKIVNR